MATTDLVSTTCRCLVHPAADSAQISSITPAPGARRALAAESPLEELPHRVAAELGTLDDRVADTREHLLEARADMTPSDLLGALLDLLGRPVHLRLVGGTGRAATQSHGHQACGRDPQPARSPSHDAPPSVRLAHASTLPPYRVRCARPADCLTTPRKRPGARIGFALTTDFFYRKPMPENRQRDVSKRFGNKRAVSQDSEKISSPSSTHIELCASRQRQRFVRFWRTCAARRKPRRPPTATGFE